MGLSHKKIIGWKEDGKVRRRLYKFWGGHRTGVCKDLG